MALVHLLYRCPRCGHDPLVGEKDQASCQECGTFFARGGEGGLIQVREPDGAGWDVPSRSLTKALEGWLEAEDPPEDPTDVLHRAEATVRRSGQEAPVRWGGQLIGFAEAMWVKVPGELRITGDHLVFSPDPKPPAGPGAVGTLTEWPFLDIRAVQTSSSSLQFSPSSGGLVEFKFASDSPYRWESLLHRGLRRAYARAGLGSIVEFQPRIVAE